MTTRATVTTICDITGETPAQNHTITIDGTTWEIDTTPDTWTTLTDTLTTTLNNHGRRPGRTRNTRKTTTNNAPAIRAWATANGHTPPARGRLPHNIIDAYNAAH